MRLAESDRQLSGPSTGPDRGRHSASKTERRHPVEAVWKRALADMAVGTLRRLQCRHGA